jgi:membrane-associated phospholipid phosphatase
MALVVCYWAANWGLGGFRADHVGVGLLVLALSYGGRRGREVLRFLLPLVLTGVVYDARRFYPDHLRGRVRVAEAYLLERSLFGIPTADGILTPNEWWQRHTHPLLDLVAGSCYITFLATFVLVAAYFRLREGRTERATRTAELGGAASPRVMWSLLGVSVLAFATASALPVAPPWYVALHGLGPADPSAAASAAGCARFDQLVGSQVFASFYRRSVDAFGAVPSLHVAYPTLIVYYAFRFGAARIASVAILVTMCFSAVYLNHHYVLDVLAGWVYALGVAVAIDAVPWRRTSADPGPSPLLPG